MEFKIKPRDLKGKSLDDIEKILSEEAIRLGFVKGIVITTQGASGNLWSIKLNGEFRISFKNHNDGYDITLHALTDEKSNSSWGVSLFKKDVYTLAEDSEYIHWIIFEIPEPKKEDNLAKEAPKINAGKILMLTFLFLWLAETAYFGFNLHPKSEAERWADRITTAGIYFGFAIYMINLFELIIRVLTNLDRQK